MRYFYDFEFIEDGKTIEPISLGMVSEDNQELYITFDFNVLKAWRNSWVRENVLKPIYFEHENVHSWDDPTTGSSCPEFNYWNMRNLIKRIGYRKNVAITEILDFLQGDLSPIELWAYYADYDHVALCQLFGKMIDLPKTFPKYTMDLKQWAVMLGNPTLPKQKSGEHNALADARWNKQIFDFLSQKKDN